MVGLGVVVLAFGVCRWVVLISGFGVGFWLVVLGWCSVTSSGFPGFRLGRSCWYLWWFLDLGGLVVILVFGVLCLRWVLVFWFVV